MQQEPTERQPPRGGLSNGAVDALAAGVIFCIGLVMMFDNHRIGSGWGADGPQPGYFPFYIGAILCMAGVVVCLKSLFGKQRDQKIFVTWERFRLVLIVLLPTTLFILATNFLGIYVASMIFIAVFMRVLGKTSWLQTALVSIGVSVVLFWMFEIQFMVPLPKGPLEALLGY